MLVAEAVFLAGGRSSVLDWLLSAHLSSAVHRCLLHLVLLACSARRLEEQIGCFLGMLQ